MAIDDMQDNREERTVYPPRVLREWLDRNSLADFYENLKRKVWGQDEELKKAAIMIYGFIHLFIKTGGFHYFWLQCVSQIYPQIRIQFLLIVPDSENQSFFEQCSYTLGH